MKSILYFIFVASLCCGSHATEPWTDPRLPVKTGVELWFDCSGQNDGRKAAGLQAILPGMPASYLVDGSGHRRDLAQLHGDARPKFQQEGTANFLDFDGTNDVLEAWGWASKFKDLTLVIVASPQSNQGGFRSFCAMTRAGFNDYTSGMNFDLGAAGTMQLAFLNVEGAGAAGMSQMMRDPPLPFGGWHVFTVVSGNGPKAVRLFLDGKPQAARDRESSEIALDAFVLGARCYSNQGDPAFIQGFFHGAISEVLLYDRALSDPERTGVENYLKDKYASLLKRAPKLAGDSKPLLPVTNLPPVQVFVPGFTVRELPLALRNINNVKYRSDGKLVALGYDGQIYLLSDTDGDGLEDRAQAFWTNNTLRAPVGMALTPPGYRLGQGVFVASKGKLSLIVDTNADDRADRAIIVAEGWQEIPHGVDALGVALDKDGNVFFGLGTANFTDAYLIDKSTGAARYDLRSERGTILKVSADFQHREIVCTGIRFPVGMAFDREGSLFCTDQEGATWLPNGNPLDELLFIEPGRHYGFPPRHPKYLPGVIDEPSVFDYAPQHQSTCGLTFNEAVNGGPTFGPAHWAGDALVCGYSRGKIWRTKLVKTEAGYVAQNQLIVSLASLTVDACVSPRGDLLVSTHSGEPDWGSGPNGMGKLYKITYAERELPQPVAVSLPAPGAFNIAFDRPVDPATLRDLSKRAEITQGQYVGAGDRFESKRPGYAVVYNQLSSPRYDLPVESVSVSPDGRTIVLRTPPSDAAANYSISLAHFERDQSPAGNPPQYPDVELVADASGVQVDWEPDNGGAGNENAWQGWFPHLDLSVAKNLTHGSAEHEALWPKLQSTGKLTVRGQLDLWQMLQPAIQPGATLDYERPREEVTVVFSAAVPFKVRLGVATAESSRAPDGSQQVALNHRSQPEWLPFEIVMLTGHSSPTLRAVWFTADDSRPRTFPLRRFLMPWAKPDIHPGSSDSTTLTPPKELAGGNWLRGKRLFFGDSVACYKCHSIRGEGNTVGPDLSNLVHRDYPSVLRDIRFPNAALNPDHPTYSAQLADGEEFTGILQESAGETITLADASGRRSFEKRQVKSLKATGTSLMPEGLDKALGEEQLKDLLTFLLTPPLQPAAVHIPDAPPPRKRSELNAALQALGASNGVPMRILLCSGPKDHGIDEHDYPLWQERWARLLGLAENVTVATSPGWPTSDAIGQADVIVFYSNNPGWSEAAAAELDPFQQRGGGLVYIHFAVDGHDAVEALSQRIGLAWRSGHSKFRHGPLALELAPSNPIVRGLSHLELHDESYWDLIGDPASIQVLATNLEEGKPRPLIWTCERGRGRAFVSIPGHYTWTFDDPLFRLVLLRGICWAAHQSENRLDELAVLGARLLDSPGPVTQDKHSSVESP